MNHFTEYGPTFCALPWIHFMTQPQGTLQVCGNSNQKVMQPNGEPFALDQHKLQEIWNSPYYQEMRKKMLAGEKLPNCQACFAQEEIGKISFRQISNWWWSDRFPETLREKVKESKENEYKILSLPQSLDLRLGNQCNISCRTCNPGYSSTLGKEWDEMSRKQKEFQEFWSPEEKSKNNYEWFNNESIMSEIHEALKNTKLLYITGGEPTLVKKNYELLSYCVEQGFSPDMELMLNTNLTIQHKKFYALFETFKHVQFNGSIDGFRKLNEYLRYPSKWNDIEENLNYCLTIPGNISITINTVVQYHNVLNLTDILSYVEGLRNKYRPRRLNIELTLLLNPKWLSIHLLPKHIRELAHTRLQKFAQTSRMYEEDMLSRRNIDGILNALSSDPTPGLELLEKNKLFTKQFDLFRSMSLDEANPELFQLLEINEKPAESFEVVNEPFV